MYKEINFLTGPEKFSAFASLHSLKSLAIDIVVIITIIVVITINIIIKNSQ